MSVSSYAGSTYAFIATPDAGIKTVIDIYNKLATPMRAINTSHPSTASVAVGDKMLDASITDMELTVVEYAANIKGS